MYGWSKYRGSTGEDDRHDEVKCQRVAGPRSITVLRTTSCSVAFPRHDPDVLTFSHNALGSSSEAPPCLVKTACRRRKGRVWSIDGPNVIGQTQLEGLRPPTSGRIDASRPPGGISATEGFAVKRQEDAWVGDGIR